VIALYFVLLLVTSGQLIRFVPGSFSAAFFIIELLGVALVSLLLGTMFRLFKAEFVQRKFLKTQILLGFGTFLFLMGVYTWSFDWPTNVTGGEPMDNSGVGFVIALADWLAGTMAIVFGFLSNRKSAIS